MRKYICIILALLVIIIMAAPTVSALSAGEVDFGDDPIYPGDTVDLWIEIQNSGAKKEDIELRLVHHAEDLYSAAPASRVIGILDGSASIRRLDTYDRTKVHFVIFISPKAKGGLYDLDLVVSGYTTETEGYLPYYGNISAQVSEDMLLGPKVISMVSVYVTGKDPSLIVSTSNNDFAPDSEGQITLTLKNKGEAEAENVWVEVNPIPQEKGDDGESIIPKQVTDLMGDLGSIGSLVSGGSEKKSDVPEFTIIGSGTRFYMGNIKPGKTATTTFTMVVDPQTEKGNYNFPIKITYGGVETTEYIGVRVLSKANLVIPETKTDPRVATPGGSVTYIVAVENIGKNDAKSVSVEIDNGHISGRTTDYIGTIEAGDEGTAIFDMDISKDASGKDSLPITITVTFQDDMGTNSFIESGVIPLKNTGVSEERSGALDYFRVGAILIVLSAVSFVLYRKGSPR